MNVAKEAEKKLPESAALKKRGQNCFSRSSSDCVVPERNAK